MRLHIGLMACGVFLTFFGGVPRAPAQAAPGHPDFKGVWRMDTTKFEKHDALLAALRLTVSQLGDTVRIVTDVVDTGHAPVQMRASYVPAASLASSESPVSGDSRGGVGSLDWQGDTLVLRRTERRPDRTLEIEERWALDASGQTLSRYQSVRDGARRSRQTLVFTRQ